MRLKEIIKDLELTAGNGDQNPLVRKITFDSREVRKGDLFVAIRGVQADGHNYIDAAIASGAAALICEETGDRSDPGIPLICVPDSR